MNKIKQFLRNASIKFHMIFMSFLILVILAAAWMYTNISPILFYILFGMFILLFVIDAYFAVHKTAENYLLKYERECFNEVKKSLFTEYAPIYVFSSSSLDKSLTYYGKLNEDNTISVYGKNKYGKKEFNASKKDYMWFMENFFVI